MNNKLIIIRARYETTISTKLYNNILKDIYSLFDQDNVSHANSPFKIITKKGILVRQGKGKGKFYTLIKTINNYNNIILCWTKNPEKTPYILKYLKYKFIIKYPFLEFIVLF